MLDDRCGGRKLTASHGPGLSWASPLGDSPMAELALIPGPVDSKISTVCGTLIGKHPIGFVLPLSPSVGKRF